MAKKTHFCSWWTHPFWRWNHLFSVVKPPLLMLNSLPFSIINQHVYHVSWLKTASWIHGIFHGISKEFPIFHGIFQFSMGFSMGFLRLLQWSNARPGPRSGFGRPWRAAGTLPHRGEVLQLRRHGRLQGHRVGAADGGWKAAGRNSDEKMMDFSSHRSTP